MLAGERLGREHVVAVTSGVCSYRFTPSFSAARFSPHASVAGCAMPLRLRNHGAPANSGEFSLVIRIFRLLIEKSTDKVTHLHCPGMPPFGGHKRRFPGRTGRQDNRRCFPLMTLFVADATIRPLFSPGNRMLLNVNPFHRDNDRFNVSFKALGELIETVGTPHFVPRLTQLLNEVVPLDVAHVERSRVDGSMPTGYRCEWIGSSGIDTASAEISAVMTLYYERFLDSDPLFAGLRGKTGTMLVVRDIAAIPPGEFRQRLFDDVHIGHECVLARGTRYSQHSIALERGRDRPPFTLAEMNRFRSISDVLFPLLELHASTTAVRRVAHPTPDVHPLAQFDARIAADGVKLSKREYETCKHLLSGKTVPETAEILGVRVASAESYVKRAFAKLGVRTKRELAAWGAAATAFPCAGPHDGAAPPAVPR